MVERKYVVYDGKPYSYFPCTRCLNGTMAWERDKTDIPPYLKCVLCGKEEVIRPKKSENLPKKDQKKPHSRYKKGVKGQGETENKGVKTAISAKDGEAK